MILNYLPHLNQPEDGGNDAKEFHPKKRLAWLQIELFCVLTQICHIYCKYDIHEPLCSEIIKPVEVTALKIKERTASNSNFLK